MKDTLFIALDVHKETISVATAKWDRSEAESLGTILNTPQAIAKLLRKLGRPMHQLHFCYEAGPCGYGIYRQITAAGAKCDVIAPSLVPQKAGDKVKTDRRDAEKLARNLRNGELTPVWVPDEKHEALRDLSRGREDAQEDLRIKRQQLLSFLLRYDIRPPETIKSNWTKAHRTWLNSLQFPDEMQRIVLGECLLAIDQAFERVERLEKALLEQAKNVPQAPLIDALQCLRGIAGVSAATIVAELGDITRFPSAKQIMSAMGLVPSEHSSGAHVRKGSITKSGNAHARFILVEAAWHYRHAPHIGDTLRRRQENQSEEIRRIAWKAQSRLSTKYRRMVGRGKSKQITIIALARELAGFIWSIAHEVTRQQQIPKSA
jgi:transposase